MENYVLVLKVSASKRSTSLLPTYYVTPKCNSMGLGTFIEERKRGKFRENKGVNYFKILCST